MMVFTQTLLPDRIRDEMVRRKRRDGGSEGSRSITSKQTCITGNDSHGVITHAGCTLSLCVNRIVQNVYKCGPRAEIICFNVMQDALSCHNSRLHLRESVMRETA